MLNVLTFEKDPLKPAGHAIHAASKMDFRLTAVVITVDKESAQNANQESDKMNAQKACSCSLTLRNSNVCLKAAALSLNETPDVMSMRMMRMITNLLVNDSLQVQAQHSEKRAGGRSGAVQVQYGL